MVEYFAVNWNNVYCFIDCLIQLLQTRTKMNDSLTSLRSDVINPKLLSAVTLVSNVVNSTEMSVFERYTWTELLAVHGPTALQVRQEIQMKYTKHKLQVRNDGG